MDFIIYCHFHESSKIGQQKLLRFFFGFDWNRFRKAKCCILRLISILVLDQFFFSILIGWWCAGFTRWLLPGAFTGTRVVAILFQTQFNFAGTSQRTRIAISHAVRTANGFVIQRAYAMTCGDNEFQQYFFYENWYLNKVEHYRKFHLGVFSVCDRIS